ncbi:hypothetical protein [Methylorubrum thiocyanatum]|uniref:hypothetical protein n=1 Tax=Methylorubrum thiocyanatum TaxID=47958 RepID=UPI003F81DB2C
MALVACNLAALLVLLTIWRAEPEGIATTRPAAVDPARSSRLPSPDGPAVSAPITAKTLFRVPKPVVKAASNDQPSLPAPKPPFWLVGIVWGETDRFAIVQSSRTGPIHRVRAGETVDRWRLEHMTARVATFRMNDQSVPLDLQRARSPASDPTPNTYGRVGRH